MNTKPTFFKGLLTAVVIELTAVLLIMAIF